MTLNPSNPARSLEQLALESGYVPQSDGTVTSPYGKTLKPFFPNKHVPLGAIKFNHSEVDVESGVIEKRPVTVYVHRLIWTHATGESLTPVDRIGFSDGDTHNLSIGNLYREAKIMLVLN